MRFIVTADLHLFKWNEHAKLNEHGQHTRLMDGLSVLVSIREYAIANRIKVVIIAGDLFHKRAVLDVETFNLVFAELLRFQKEGILVYLMDGNHDQATKDGRIHSLEAFRKVGAIVTGRRDMMVNAYGVRGGAAAWVSFFPYSDNAARLYEAVKKREQPKLPNTIRKIAVMHHGFKGARVGSSLEYVVKEPILPERIGAEGFDFVFSGHYHGRQTLQPRLMYIGSPQEHIRTDRFEGQKGFLVYNTVKNSVEVVPLNLPRFVTLDIEELGGLKSIPAAWRASDVDVKGNFVDLVVPRMEAAPELVEKLMTKFGARAVKVIPKTYDVEITRKRLDVDPTMSASKAMKRYVNWSIRNKRTNLDKEELIAAGREILREID